MPLEDRKQWKAQIERSAAERHPAAEPPEAWPPPVKEGVGSSFGPPPSPDASARVERTHKLFSGIWGVILVIVGAFGGGVATMRIVNDYPTKADLKTIADKLEELKKSNEANQLANETTFATIKSNIEWLKALNRSAAEEPIKSKKKP